jgi:hypothetical protein
MTTHQFYSVLVGGIEHAVAGGEVNGQWFFNKDVFSGFSRRYGNFFVKRMGVDYQNGLHIRVCS